MRRRLAKLLEAVDPHLRRRERMAPGDETDALGALFAVWQSSVTASGVTRTGLNTTFTGIAGATLSARRFPANVRRLSSRFPGP